MIPDVDTIANPADVSSRVLWLLRRRLAERHGREIIVANWVRQTKVLGTYRDFIALAESQNEPPTLLDLNVKGRG